MSTHVDLTPSIDWSYSRGGDRLDALYCYPDSAGVSPSRTSNLTSGPLYVGWTYTSGSHLNPFPYSTPYAGLDQDVWGCKMRFDISALPITSAVQLSTLMSLSLYLNATTVPADTRGYYVAPGCVESSPIFGVAVVPYLLAGVFPRVGSDADFIDNSAATSPWNGSGLPQIFGAIPAVTIVPSLPPNVIHFAPATPGPVGVTYNLTGAQRDACYAAGSIDFALGLRMCRHFDSPSAGTTTSPGDGDNAWTYDLLWEFASMEDGTSARWPNLGLEYDPTPPPASTTIGWQIDRG